ncbi:sigma 54 modulation/S30EA ribosomal C-terminal domain-containing protein [Nocardia sp. NPDC051463]|uniref:sigma 54 modulation/S30EA ribosomal C-terminal domain-containing protein n=1 Tax=Nocardia sp. NPDC051463 TaxID=3154845 RepID=UPI00342447B0
MEIERVAGAVGRLLARYAIEGGARVKIAGANCANGPLLVQVNLRVRGTPARIQTLTPGAGVVLPAVVRLEELIRRLSTGRQTSLGPDPTRPPLASSGAGVIIRRKHFTLLMAAPATAVSVMDAMDYDAHLFTDAATGADAIVYRSGPSAIRFARQRLHDPSAASSVTVDAVLAPELSEAQAVDRLCDAGLPFLLFTDPGDGRGHLLYRRYDADLGLVAPVAAEQATTT